MTKFLVHVSPNAKANRIIGWRQDALWLKIAAPAREGGANLELVRFLASQLSITPADLKILSGQSSRYKKIEASNLALEEIKKRLQTELF